MNLTSQRARCRPPPQAPTRRDIGLLRAALVVVWSGLPASLLTALGVMVALGITAVPTRAAMCTDLSTEPGRPVQQTPTKVIAKEQWAVIGGDSFDLVARRDGDADILIRLSRLSTGSLTWVGEATFPQAGEWKLRVAIADADNHYSCFEKALTVVAVGDMDREISDRLSRMAAIMLAPIAALILGLLLAARIVRQRSV